MSIKILLGKTLTEISGAIGDEELRLSFLEDQGPMEANNIGLRKLIKRTFIFYHPQDCCESVLVEDIEGDIQDLVGSPILQADEETSKNPFDGKPEHAESFTWTFYRFATAKGSVVIRWLGESNGYYSENVFFKEV